MKKLHKIQKTTRYGKETANLGHFTLKHKT